jgi:energy-coupling factor transport system permease protein
LVVVITVVAALFKGLTLHSGDTVLFTLPEDWLLVGGPVTLEGLVWAGLDAMQILAVLSVFMAFSAAADYYALLRATPAFMHQAGLVTSIGITFVPQTVARFMEVREAQALRGHRIRRVSDFVPWIIPLLGGGMERSLNLAEAMEARGFSRVTPGARPVSPLMVQLGIAGGLLLVLAGAVLFAFWPPELAWANWAILSGGVLLIALTLWAVGRGARRVRYRRGAWRVPDTLLALASGATIFALVAYRILAPSRLEYVVFPRIETPGLDPVVAIALALLAAPPAILALARK